MAESHEPGEAAEGAAESAAGHEEAEALRAITQAIGALAVAIERMNQPVETVLVVDGKVYRAVNQTLN